MAKHAADGPHEESAVVGWPANWVYAACRGEFEEAARLLLGMLTIGKYRRLRRLAPGFADHEYEELAQVVMVELLLPPDLLERLTNGWRSIDPRAAAQVANGYVRLIAIRKGIDLRRTLSWRRNVYVDESDADVIAPQPDPELQGQLLDEVERFEDCLNKLGDLLRKTLSLVYLDNGTSDAVKNAALILAVAPKIVYDRVYKARQYMKRCMKRHGNDREVHHGRR